LFVLFFKKIYFIYLFLFYFIIMILFFDYLSSIIYICLTLTYIFIFLIFWITVGRYLFYSKLTNNKRKPVGYYITKIGAKLKYILPISSLVSNFSMKIKFIIIIFYYFYFYYYYYFYYIIYFIYVVVYNNSYVCRCIYL
jgi:hypothetical protein